MERDALHAWLTERLTGGRAFEDFQRLIDAGWDEARGRTVSEVLPRAAVDALVAAHLTPDRLAELIRPVTTVIVGDVIADLRAEHLALAHWVPAATQARIEALVMRPGAVDPDFVRALFKEKAMEAMLSDTLTTTIREFSTIIPKLILNFMPKGGALGLLGGVGNKVVEEVEKRIEPEIRSFLQNGTKKALDRAAGFVITHADDPTSVEARRNMVRFVMSRTSAQNVRPLDDTVVKEIAVIGDEIARHVATLPEAKARVTAVLDRFYQRYGSGTVGAALDAHGLTTKPPLEAIAAAAWPAVRAIIAAPSLTVWRNALVDELLAKSAE